MNWYKKAKIGDEYLKAKGVPDANIPSFTKYLNSFPDNIQKYLVKKFISKNPNITLKELKSIPITIEKEIKVNPKMEILIKQISENKKERQWLRNLVIINRFQEEDTVKLQNMLKELHNLPKDSQANIDEFKDDIELSEYLNLFKMTQEIKGLPQEGWELLENENIGNYNVKLYYITSQQALDTIGKGASWCVLTEKGQMRYEPMEYYCFVINGEAKILIHPETNQMKDRNDGQLRDAILIKTINPMINAYGLNTDKGDFADYTNQIQIIKDFENNQDNEELISSALKNNLDLFTLLDKSQWSKYIPLYVKFMYSKFVNLDTMGYDLLEYLANYLKNNNDEEGFNYLEKNVMDWFKYDDNHLTVGRYKKVIPPILRTPTANKLFNELREKSMISWVDNIAASPSEYKNCPFEEVKNNPEVKQKAMNFWENKIIKGSGEFWEEDVNSCPFPEIINNPEFWEKALSESKWFPNWKAVPIDKVKYDPKIWKQIILKFPYGLAVCPIEEVKNDPEVIAAVFTYWKNFILMNPSRYTECPIEEVKNDPEVKQKAIEWWTNYVISAPEKWKECPFPEIKKNYETRKQLLLKNPDYWHVFYPSQLKELERDPDYWKQKLLRYPTEMNWKLCPFPEVKNDPEIYEKFKDLIRLNVIHANSNRLWSTRFNDNFISKLNPQI